MRRIRSQWLDVDDIEFVYPERPIEVLRRTEDLRNLMMRSCPGYWDEEAIAEMVNVPDGLILAYVGFDLAGATYSHTIGKRIQQVHLAIDPTFQRQGVSTYLGEVTLKDIFFYRKKPVMIAKVPMDNRLARVCAWRWGLKQINTERDCYVYKMHWTDYGIRTQKESQRVNSA